MVYRSRWRDGGSTPRKKEQLIENHEEVDGTQNENHASGHAELAVKAQNDKAEGDEGEFPDPEAVAVKSDRGTDHRVDLKSPLFEDHHGEEGVQDVEADEQDEEEEQRGAVAVCVASLPLVGLSSEVLSPAQEAISAKGGSRFLSSVSEASLVLFFQGG